MRREGTLLGDPPDREVVRVVDLVGPRGGTTYVLTLSCGHWVASRKLLTKTTARCVGCLVDAAVRGRMASGEDITDPQLLELGRAARGTSHRDLLTRSLVPVALGLRKETVAEVQYARRKCASLWNARFPRG